MTRWLAASIGAALIFSLAGCAPGPAEPPLDPAQKRELETLRQQLLEPGRLAKTRQESARLLLSRNLPQADRILIQALHDSSTPAAQIAVAQAITHDLPQRPVFIEPLQSLLGADDEPVRSAAGMALASYQDPEASRILQGMARDRSAPTPVRISAINALGRVLSRSSVDTLLDCLADPAPAVRRQAGKTLEQLTGQTDLGTDPSAWRAWWQANRNKPRAAWLEEMVLHLTRTRQQIELQNDVLRQRLGRAMEELYNASAATQKPVILLTMMKDPVADIRLRGVSLAEQLLAAEGTLPESLLQHVRLLLDDRDPRIRRASIGLLTAAGAEGIERLILHRLRDEIEPQVRAGLLAALGQQGDAASLDRICQALASSADVEAIAAARSLGKIASEHPLDQATRQRAINALLAKYQQSAEAADSLVEALLTAMAAVGDGQELAALFTEALGDDSGLIRLAAVNGLPRLKAESAGDALAGLLDDPDRGVRQATIDALVELGQVQFLPAILERTAPQAEPDPAVQKAATQACIRLAGQASPRLLTETLVVLEEPRTELRRQVEIALLQQLIQQSDPEDLALRVALNRRLSSRLIEADREDEAVIVLAGLMASLRAHAGSDEAAWRNELFMEYIAALLAADDANVAVVLASQGDDTLYDVAVREIQGRLSELNRQQEYARAIRLASAVLEKNRARLSSEQSRAMTEQLTLARQQQLQTDRKQVATLTARLLSTDSAAQTDARTQLVAMDGRAVTPLLDELRQLVLSETPDPQAEQRLFDILKQLAPALGEYDPAAPREQKLARIKSWMK